MGSVESVPAVGAASLKIDFLQKFTLSGSPITIIRSEAGGGSSIPLLRSEPPIGGNEVDGATNDLIMPVPTHISPYSTSPSPPPATRRASTPGINTNNSPLPFESNPPSELLTVTSAIPSRVPSPMDVKGLVSLEIVAAQNLPRERRMFRVHYTNNPFVVISFGKQSFRTKVIKRTVNPVWKEKCFFTVKESEARFYVIFSVYDYDKLSFNACTGTTSLQASTLLSRPNEIQKLALPLKVSSTAGGSLATLTDACLLVKACFISYDVLRKNFWEVLARQYDHDENGRLNRVELSTMLASIGSTLSEDTLDAIIKKLDVDVNGEIALDNIVSGLEALTVRAKRPEHEEENIVLIRTCPICNRHFSRRGEDIDVITHLAICAAQDAGKLDKLVMGGFLTEDYASRKWFMRLISFMSFGGYRLGKNNGNILVQDRRTGKLHEERMPTYIRLGIRWMHQYSAYKRAVDSSMVRQIFQTLTIKQGRKFDDPASARSIPEFIRYHRLNVDEIAEPLSSFRTFNEFFYRRLKPGVRSLASSDPLVAVSPADCRLNVFTSVDEATRLWIKGANFSLAALLKDEQLATYYEGGSLIVCRLAPQDYHRFHSPIDGHLTLYYHIPGTYFTVNPMAVRQKIDVYTENARTICLLDSDHFGKVAFVAIGAMMVGSIVITAAGGSHVSRLDELGYFAFGGSTIVVLFPPGAIILDQDLVANSHEQVETLVQVGNSIGHSAGKHSRRSR